MSVREASSSSGRYMPTTQEHGKRKQAVGSDQREEEKNVQKNTSPEEPPN